VFLIGGFIKRHFWSHFSLCTAQYVIGNLRSFLTKRNKSIFKNFQLKVDPYGPIVFLTGNQMRAPVFATRPLVRVKNSVEKQFSGKAEEIQAVFSQNATSPLFSIKFSI